MDVGHNWACNIIVTVITISVLTMRPTLRDYRRRLARSIR